MFSGLLHRLRAAFQRKRVEEELEDELQFHLQHQIEKHSKMGWSDEEAARRARMEFGGFDQVKEEYRDSLGTSLLETILQDVRHAGRMMRRSPGFTAVAVISLSIGIGANTAVFSVIDSLFLRPLNVRNPGELVSFVPVRPDLRIFMPFLPEAANAREATTVSFREFEQLRSRSSVFAGMFVSTGVGRGFRMTVVDDSVGRSEEVQVERVSSDFFATLGVGPALGRAFAADEDRPGAPMVAVISYGFWNRRFGLDPEVIGKSITVTRDRIPSESSAIMATVIGVTSPGFTGFEVGASPDIWLPLQGQASPQPPTRFGWWGGYRMMARLRAGVNLEQAQIETRTVFRRLLDEWAGEFGPEWTAVQRERFLEQRLEVESGGTGWTNLRGQFQQRLAILMAAVAVLLLIASVNVAALLLARGTRRQKELAVRLAIGSGRPRLIRQLLTESVTLAAIGGFTGLVVAHWGIQLLLGYIPALSVLVVRLDIQATVFAAGISLVSAILFGLIPAWSITKPDLNPTLKSPQNNLGSFRSRFALNNLLVASQIALSMILLVGTGLLVRTLQNLRHLDPGFDKQGIVVIALDRAIDLGRSTQVLERMQGLPGVQAATAWQYGLPVSSGGMMSVGPIHVDGHVPEPDEDLTAFASYVGPQFFETMGISLLAGREFTPQDAQGRRKAVISAAMAKHYFGGRDPIGRGFLSNGPNPGAAGTEIIGVAEDAKYNNLREAPSRAFYLPFTSNTEAGNFAVRTTVDAVSLANAIRDAVAEVDTQIRVTSIRSIEEALDTTLVPESSLAELAGLFSVLAVSLTCIGLYGTLSYAVAHRTNEIGIRMALGARVQHVMGLIAREAAWIVGSGVLVGVLGTLAATRLISTFLFGLAPNDPMTIAAAALLLAIATGAAAYLPVRRACRVDPVVALRHE